jgi:hypothetical protein
MSKVLVDDDTEGGIGKVISHKYLDRDDTETTQNIAQTGIALSTAEAVCRHGSATAELIKGYNGIDNETGQRFKGLSDISRHKVSTNPVEAAKNIKQQAGFSAEVAATSVVLHS